MYENLSTYYSVRTTPVVLVLIVLVLPEVRVLVHVPLYSRKPTMSITSLTCRRAWEYAYVRVVVHVRVLEVVRVLVVVRVRAYYTLMKTVIHTQYIVCMHALYMYM